MPTKRDVEQSEQERRDTFWNNVPEDAVSGLEHKPVREAAFADEEPEGGEARATETEQARQQQEQAQS